MPDRPVTHLRSVSLAVPDLTASTTFLCAEWGLTEVATDTGLTYLRAEGSHEQYVLRLRKAADRRIDVIAFGAPSLAAVDVLAERLRIAGVRLITEPGALDQPGGGHGFRFFGPDGLVLEVSADVAPGPARELAERESIPAKVSHVVINTPDIAATADFLVRHLDFRISDWLADQMVFLRCGTDHHAIAINHADHVSLNHISFEMRGIDEFLRATGRLKRCGREMIWGPGRHGPGDNTFAYFGEPNGYVMEFTTALQHIPGDCDWKPTVWERRPENSDQWGIAGPFPERAAVAFGGVPDPGLWTPPPV